jgi:hypothetical protein
MLEKRSQNHLLLMMHHMTTLKELMVQIPKTANPDTMAVTKVTKSLGTWGFLSPDGGPLGNLKVVQFWGDTLEAQFLKVTALRLRGHL